jgi:hypothetical protein
MLPICKINNLLVWLSLLTVQSPINLKTRAKSEWHKRKTFLARQDNCLESYCHDPGVSVTPQGKNFNLGYIF